ncbi:UNVERIFIED_CONTAM: hypothetical protein GTU68_009946 [Idotea baltica]|nr:hypothetical protein [Idotea baltica]
MTESVTPDENTRAFDRYRESLTSARLYAEESPEHALERFNDSIEFAREYANRSNAESTWKAYESDWKAFETWCRSVAAASLPATPETVSGFLATEAKHDRAISTIRRRLAAIRLMHIARDYPSPHEAYQVTRVLKGIANAQKNRPVRKAKAVGDADIKRMIDALKLSSAKGMRDTALLLIGFDGALRRSELVMITVEMIEERPEGLLIDLPYSKSDQQGDGQIIPILARPGSRYCPVAALQRWIEYSDCKEGLIFKRLHKGNKIGKTGLSAQSVALIVKDAVKRAEFKESEVSMFSGHSLRRGVMTESARTDASLSQIMHLGRHKKADTAMGYIDRESALENHPTKRPH